MSLVEIFCHLRNEVREPGVVVHTCKPSNQEAEARRSPVQGQPGLRSKFEVTQRYTMRPFGGGNRVKSYLEIMLRFSQACLFWSL
jgi:hypothetical protein